MGTRRTVINGKVMRTPTVGHYDDRTPRPNPTTYTELRDPLEFNQQFVKDRPSTWHRDKALLVALGVDGDVPYMQACWNVGLASDTETYLVRGRVSVIIDVPANDNQKIAVAA